MLRSNAWSLEQLLTHDARLGTALTLIQMVFTALHSFPVLLGPRSVPLHAWATQVVVLTAMSLLNGWVFLYPVPITVQIIFRSAALIVSMVFNWALNGKRYSLVQLVRPVAIE